MTEEREVDPGDAVPEGVAPRNPPPLTEEDRAIKRKLEELGKPRDGTASPATPARP